MPPDRYHYERAFEEYLRSRRIPYVSVDEARKALVPRGGAPAGVGSGADLRDGSSAGNPSGSLKSFDFVIYGQGQNLLIDVKGRKVGSRSPGPAERRGRPSPGDHGGPARRRKPDRRWRLESWVTQEDVDSLGQWKRLFGPAFEAGFVFVYWCDEQPPDALFQEVFEHRSRWYALRVVTLTAYAATMKQRSACWRTVYLPADAFERVSQPFAPARVDVRGRNPGWSCESDPGPELPALLPYGASLASG